ncbi:hypothetical protein K3X48_05875 [Aliiroseovarius crassostreae]|uniref:Uncharacterized protein n=1 Tax=Aliiroseovarius crassostreae TaxID=154981 RepID=A0A9Q9HFZ4_9RHOB|nr:hypothetical protein [Aliiroseovarius crassostreae]UWP96502.1 hypothetical protein K3X48_05875 [Aliiroseovarius crassostreae]
MHIEIEREVHEMTLETLRLGRLLAEEWLGGSLVPRGSSKSIILEALYALRDRNGFKTVGADLIELMGEQIRKTLNEIREGKGDAALSEDVDLVWEQNQKVVEYVNLAYRWKQFKAARVALEDKLAAIREADTLLASALD